VQALIGAICLLLGYLIGVLLFLIFRLLKDRFAWDWPGARVRFWVRIALAVITVALVVAGGIMWHVWQNEHRDLVQMPHLSPWSSVLTIVITAGIAAVLLLVARMFGFLVIRFDQALRGRLQRWVAHGAVAASLVVLAVCLYFVGQGVFGQLESKHGQIDETTDPGVTQPTNPEASGSPQSLVAWDSLGRFGRTFVVYGVSAEELREFAGPDASVKQPIRAYVGLKSADTVEARSALAVRELERAGGFDRSVLVIWNVTGKGWVDPVAARAVEYIWSGDTAIVAQQYSNLPSALSFLVDGAKCTETGKSLTDAVYAYWSKLPANDRPSLLVFGESLGSRAAEGAFLGDDAAASVADIVSETDGMLLVGPTDSNAIWKQLLAAREQGSPAWRAVYDGGDNVRFIDRAADVATQSSWEGPHVLYLQHPSDAVGWWNVKTLVVRPDWTRGEKPYDLPDSVGWFPLVTWVQVTFDLFRGFAAGPGYGHDYDPDVAAAWTAVSSPPDWTAEDTTRLSSLMETEALMFPDD